MILILVRINVIKVGDVEVPGYAGWFTATQMNFSSGEQAETKKKGESENSVGKKAGPRVEPRDPNMQELALDKTIDSATVYLMYYAMKNRAENKSEVLTVDIHLVNSKGDASDGAGGGLSPFLRIRIENAIIKSWSINAGEDGRPSESLTIWFNRVAMKYTAFDGKVVKDFVKGWDQHENIDFNSPELNKK